MNGVRLLESETAAEGCFLIMTTLLTVAGALGALAGLLGAFLWAGEGSGRVPWGVWAVMLGGVALFLIAGVSLARGVLRFRELRRASRS